MGYELYSWQEPNGSWTFRLLPSPSGVNIRPEEVFNKKFLLHGVDIAGWPGGLTSGAHTDDDVARTVAAFESTFDLLAAEGAL